MSSGSLTFRLATNEDAVQLEYLINTAFRADTTTQVFLSVDHARVSVTDVSSIIARVAEPNCAVLAATDSDGALVAHCSLRKLDEDRAWLGMLAINVLYQNRGLGSQVLAYAERYARQEWASTRLEFDVVCTRTELITWYKCRGYQETGKTTPFPYDRHGDWRGILREDLHFVILGKDLSENIQGQS